MSSPETAKIRSNLARVLTHACNIIAQRNSGTTPLDGVCRQYFRTHTNIGSADRRNSKDIVFRVYRKLRTYLDVLDGLADISEMSAHTWQVIVGLSVFHERSTEAGVFAELYPDNPYASRFLELLRKTKATLSITNLPRWVEDKGLCTEILKSFDVAATHAVRVNTLRASPVQMFRSLCNMGLECQQSSEVSEAIRVPATALTKLPSYAKGHYEIQDISSQLLCKIISPEEEDRGLDYCAGAGGKSLALAAMKKNQGQIVASDIDRKRLGRGRGRAKRAGATNISFVAQSELQNFTEYRNFDWVLVDAPCSGSGTWHRNPDMRWFGSEEEILKYQKIQREILTAAAQRVRVGGKLIYATCSLFAEENETNINWFLANNSNFMCIDVRALKLLSAESLEYSDQYLRLYPLQHGRDGFFGAVMIRI